MYTVGIDIVDIARIEKSIENERFITKVYGGDEQSELRHRHTENYASAFCAKEAFSKALGTGVRNFALNEVELLHDDLGKPYLKLSDNVKSIASKLGFCDFSISVSHTNTVCTAIVIGQRKE